MTESSSVKANGEVVLKNATQFLDNQYLCDIEIFCDEITIGSYHKVILTASCSYFKRFLNAASKQYHFKNLDIKAVEEIMLYLYGKRINVKLENAFKLLRVASLLELENLMTLCKDVVIRETASCEALKVRNFFMTYDMQDAASSIDQIIYKNFNEVILSTDFLDATYEYVNNLTRCDRLVINNEGDVFKAIHMWIAHDYCNRRNHVETLFKNVKIPLLQLKFIHEVIDNDPLFNSVDALRDFQKQSFNYILNNETKSDQILLKEYHFNKRIGYVENDLEVSKQTETTDISWMMVLGGQSQEHKLNTTEFSSNDYTTWKSGPNMPTAKTNFAAVIYSGCIYVLGGQDAMGKPTANCEMYNPKIGEWKWVKKLHEPRANHSAYKLGKSITVNGGINQNGVQTNDSFSLNLKEYGSKNWKKLRPMLATRSNHFTCFLRGKIYAIGGSNNGSNEVHDFQDRQWKSIAEMNVNRSLVGGAVLDDYIYIIGGVNASLEFESSIEYYNCLNNSWTLLTAKLPIARCGMSAFSDNDRLYISGGIDKTGAVHDTVDELEIDKNRLIPVGRLNQARYGHHSLMVSYQNNDAFKYSKINKPRKQRHKSDAKVRLTKEDLDKQ